MSDNLALSLKGALLDFLAPLRESASDPRLLDDWLSTLGYTQTITRDPALGQIVSQAEAIGKSLEALEDGSLDSWEAIAGLLEIGRGIDGIRTDLQQFAANGNGTQIAATLPDDIISSLLATWLRRKHPLLFRVGAALGIVKARETATPDPILVVNDVTQRYQRALDSFDFSTIGKILGSPGTSLAELYFPAGLALAADTAVAKERLFPVLAWLADELGLAWRARSRPGIPLPPPVGEPDGPPEDIPLPSLGDGTDPASPFPPPPLPAYFAAWFPTFVVRLAGADSNEVTLEVRASSSEHPGGLSGYLITPGGTFQASQSNGPWTLTLDAHGALPALAITSTGVDIAPGAQTVDGGSATLTLRRQPNGAPFVAGNPTGTRLELGALEVDAGLLFDTARRALTLSLGTSNAALVIAPSDGDGFLADILPANGLHATFDLGLAWASDAGLSLRGSGGLQVTLPIGISVGGVLLSGVQLGLRATTAGLTAQIAAALEANLGPVHAVVDGVGVEATLNGASAGGNLGMADLAIGLKGPTGVGLSLDAHGVLTGGGFLEYDPGQGMYAGVMQLSLQDSLTLTAYGVIATRMPDASRGYSLLIFITADGFKPIPLGFGFMLQSIGGMVGVNRTFDQDVLKAGLKTDTLSTLLFPRDPVGNAPALIQAIAAAFPAKRDAVLLGLMARITWFTPTLVQMDMALILELGARTRLLVLGRVSSLLPSRDNDLIRLNLDAMGVLDFDAGTLEADAVLVDSRLVHQFPVTGSAALRARWPGVAGAVATAAAGPVGAAETGANFVLAVGGLNPRFAAPAGFPTLDRVAIALCSGRNPRLICDAYLAITANTVQFGARASLYAEALGFSVTGDVGFDALVTILPPHFLVDFHAAMQLKRGSHNLFKITLNGTLEGPLPLRISARAKFDILWISFSVPFDFTLAAGDASKAALPAVTLVTELTNALADPASWSTRRSPTLAHGVALRSLPPGATPVLDPLGQLVVQQQVVPLNTSRDVDTYGGVPVAGPRRFQMQATLNGQPGTAVSGTFAPARYFVMSDDDKLAAPSFETMDAGMVLGDGTATYDATTIVPAPLEYESIVLNAPPAAGTAAPSVPARSLAGEAAAAPAAPSRYTMPLAALQVQRPSGAAARVPVRRVGRARFRNLAATPAATLAAPRWRIVRASDGAVASVDPGVSTWSEYRDALATLNRGGARWLMVPAHELAA
jgi:hypothetical protein